MKRRSFLKSTAVAGAATLLSPGLLGLTAGCAETAGHAPAWNFDEVVDRSGTYSIKYRRAEGDRLAMWIADMDFKTDPAVSAALRERIERDVMGYTYTPDAYYDAIIGWLRTQHDYEVPREWVTACPGVIASINQAYLAFTDPGDKIIVQTPVYDPFFNYAKRLGRQVVENPLICRDGRYEMDFEGLERCFDHRTKVLVLCNPHNPIGIVWSRETLSRLAEICEHHGVLVFSDEIHGDLALFGHRQIPFCSVSPAAARIGLMFGSPTKSFNIAGLSGREDHSYELLGQYGTPLIVALVPAGSVGDGLVHYPDHIAEDELGNNPGLERRFLVDVGNRSRADVFRGLHVVGEFLFVHHNKAHVGSPCSIWFRGLDLDPITVLIQDFDHGTHQSLVT